MINHHLRWVPWWQVEVPFHVSADLSVSVSFIRMSSESPTPTWRWILICVMRHYIAPRPLELSLHALQHGTHCCFTFGFHDLGILATTTNSIRSRRRGPYGRCWNSMGIQEPMVFGCASDGTLFVIDWNLGMIGNHGKRRHELCFCQLFVLVSRFGPQLLLSITEFRCCILT